MAQSCCKPPHQPPTPFSLLLTFYMAMVHLFQLWSRWWYIIIDPNQIVSFLRARLVHSAFPSIVPLVDFTRVELMRKLNS